MINFVGFIYLPQKLPFTPTCLIYCTLNKHLELPGITEISARDRLKLMYRIKRKIQHGVTIGEKVYSH